VLPCATTQDSPAQQSALIVHLPQLGTQLDVPQTNGAPAAGFGTQGSPLQQSALDAQACPAPTHCTSVHRGTPTLSGLHVSLTSQLPEQQSHDALHDIVFSLHTSPFGLQDVGLRHTPSVPPEKTHAPVWLPQQSPSFVQRSPTTWQPLAGWQTSSPVGPYGAHSRLQHAPPHVGKGPLSAVKTPPQIVPSTIEQLAAVVGGCPQVP
jgi:hypothetical protein